jgi:hypothetical protein
VPVVSGGVVVWLRLNEKALCKLIGLSSHYPHYESTTLDISEHDFSINFAGKRNGLCWVHKIDSLLLDADGYSLSNEIAKILRHRTIIHRKFK